MILSTDESTLFFKLYMPLLDFARSIKNENLLEYRKSKLKLFANPSLIQKFIGKNPYNFGHAELEIINNWQKYISGDFIFLKQLKNNAIFHSLGENEPKIYAALGLKDPIINLVGFTPVHLCEVTLLPFKGKIVCDGLFSINPVIFGKNYCYSFNESYREAILNKSIIKTIS